MSPRNPDPHRSAIEMSANEPADVMVIFGITGDLARKMTFRALYRLERRKKLDCPIVGVAIDDWSRDHLIEHGRQAIADSGETVDDAVFARLAARLSYVVGDYTAQETYQLVAEAISGKDKPVFYLEIPPFLFGRVVQGLADADLTKNARVVVEKPFGHDLESARVLNADLRMVLDEDQILRIDHFLGKEPAMDIMFLRFANSIFEPIWDRNNIASVQITMAENFGVEDRGHFYDPVGAMRDVVQNHLLQLLALVAMEPPASVDADAIRRRRVDVFRAMPDLQPANYIRGQYDGYLEVEGVAPKSTTETFCALRLDIDNWRWSGVPFFIRAGKSLGTRVTEVRVVFKRPPKLAFAPGLRPDADHFVIRIDPTPGASLGVQVKKPGEPATRSVDLSLIFADALGAPPEPYERLLGDALVGDRSLFTGEATIEETWRLVQPLLDNPPPVIPYAKGSWGPKEADKLLRGYPSWQDPWLDRIS